MRSGETEGGCFPGAYAGVLALVAGTALGYRLLRASALHSAGSRTARMESE